MLSCGLLFTLYFLHLRGQMRQSPCVDLAKQGYRGPWPRCLSAVRAAATARSTCSSV
jgi:hypothetical protein